MEKGKQEKRVLKMKKGLKILITILIVTILISHFYIPRIITEIKNPLTYRELDDIKLPNEFMVNNFVSFDDFQLEYFIKYSKTNSAKGTIILLHGIRSKKEHFIELSTYLASKGYNAVALDLRAHGNSEGKHCTFGVKEKKDIANLIDDLKSKGFDKIGVWGQSLGGAVALQATEYDKRIQFAIVESTFTDLKTVVADYTGFHLGIKNQFINEYLVYRAGKIAGFNPEVASPYKACENISVPTLIVHGNDDKRIDIQYGRANYKGLKSHNKQFIEVDKATHLNVWEKGGKEYFNKVLEFIQTNL